MAALSHRIIRHLIIKFFRQHYRISNPIFRCTAQRLDKRNQVTAATCHMRMVEMSTQPIHRKLSHLLRFLVVTWLVILTIMGIMVRFKFTHLTGTLKLINF